MAESTQQAPWLPTTTLSGTEVLPVMSEGGRGVAVQTTTQAIADLAVLGTVVTPSELGLVIFNNTGGAFAAGDLVTIVGGSATYPYAVKADADATTRAQYVVTTAIADQATGTVKRNYTLTGVNTSAAAAVGDPVYLSTTAGGWTLTAPTGADDIVQIVGRVTIDAASGAIEFDLESNGVSKIAQNQYQALSINAAAIAADAVTTAKILDANVTLAKIVNGTGFSVIGKATTGAGVNADIVAGDETVLGRTAAGNVAFAQVATAQLAPAAIAAGPASTLFGSGTDGALASGAGTTTLTRDMFYTDGTLTTGDSIVTSGFEVRFSGTLTLATADTSAIRWTGTAGGAAAGATGGTGGAALTSAALGGGTAGGNGGTGDADAGNAGTAGTTSTNAMGNTGGTGGDGGGGSPGAGGAGATITNTVRQSVVAPPLRGATLVNSGAGGGGGGSGEGNGGDGGGGGGGGAGGGMVRVYANVLATGSNVNPGVICSIGGVGGAGAAGVAGDANGGGGAGGGGGGHVMVVYGTRTGSAITNGIRATGGAGGNGGAGSGGGAVGFGGTGGTGGRIVVINVGANTCAETAGSAGSAGSGATGGAGGACQTNL